MEYILLKRKQTEEPIVDLKYFQSLLMKASKMDMSGRIYPGTEFELKITDAAFPFTKTNQFFLLIK